jgi:hypothetical protein
MHTTSIYLRMPMWENYFHIRWCSFRVIVAWPMSRVERLLITLPEHMRSSPLLSVVHVALALVLCIVLCLFKLCSIVDSLKHVFCDNTIEKLLVELGLLYFIPWYITILFSVLNFNKLMIYLYWSPSNS